MSDKVYLGDGVYAEDDGGVVLTTEDGDRVTNTIYLDYEVIDNLMDFLRSRESAEEA